MVHEEGFYPRKPHDRFQHEKRVAGEGIETVVVNEFASGGAGDLPAFDTWPELWIEDEVKMIKAQAIVEEILTVTETDAWFCRGCQERNDASFQICWNCGRATE